MCILNHQLQVLMFLFLKGKSGVAYSVKLKLRPAVCFFCLFGKNLGNHYLLQYIEALVHEARAIKNQFGVEGLDWPADP